MKRSAFVSALESDSNDDDDCYITALDTYDSFTTDTKNEVLFFDTADLSDGEGDVLAAWAASSKPTTKLPKKSQLPAVDARHFLANKKAVLGTEKGDLYGHVHIATPQMVTADSKSCKRKPRQANKAKTATFILNANMAKSYHALSNYQDAAEPIFFHWFDNIPIPDDIKEPRVYSVSAQKLIQMLIDLGLIDGGARGGICNGKDMRLMFYHPNNERINISGVGNHLINNRRLATFCPVVETHLGRFLGIFHNYAYVPE